MKSTKYHSTYMTKQKNMSKKEKTKKDYYDILSVSKNATKEEIKKAFKKEAMKHHPDKGGYEEDFKNVKEAYSVLSDENKKEIYDETGEYNEKNEEVKEIFIKKVYDEIIVELIFKEDGVNVNKIIKEINVHIGQMRLHLKKVNNKLFKLERFCKKLIKKDNCKNDFLIDYSRMKIIEIEQIITMQEFQFEMLLEIKSLLINGYDFNESKPVSSHHMLMIGRRG